MTKSLDECRAVLEADLSQERMRLEYERSSFSEATKALLDAEANLDDNARAMYESEKVGAQHDLNCALSERIIRTKGGPATTPTAVEEALKYFGATHDVWRLCNAVMERQQAQEALVHLHHAVTGQVEKAAAVAARERAIAGLTLLQTQQLKDKEYEALLNTQQRMER